MKRMLALILSAAAGLAGPACAEVLDANASGFQLRDSVSVAAPPAQVYAALGQIQRWWNSQHTFSGSAANLSLDLKAGACFCETLPGGGSVRHMVVAAAMPGKLLRLEGALGPLQSEGAAGSLSWALAAKGQGADLVLTYTVGGYSKRGWPAWAPDVDQVLQEQLSRLKNYVETGKPESVEQKPSS